MNAGSEYLYRHIFTGLTKKSREAKPGSNCIFSEPEFEIVLLRVQQLNLGIVRIKAWHNEKLYKAVNPNKDVTPFDANWYINAYWHFQNMKLDLEYSAAFVVPYELILGDFN